MTKSECCEEVELEEDEVTQIGPLWRLGDLNPLMHKVAKMVTSCQITLTSKLTRKLCYRKDYRTMRLTAQSDNTHMVCC